MDKATIEGYICVVGTKSLATVQRNNYIGGIREMISPGAFDRALSNNNKAYMTFNHKDSRIIAIGTDLILFEDHVGLRYRAKIDDIEVITKAFNRKLNGCSFKFVSIKERIINEKETYRVIEAMELIEVTTTDQQPFYRSSVEITIITPTLMQEINKYNENYKDYELIIERIKRQQK